MRSVEFDYRNFLKTMAFLKVADVILKKKYSKKQVENIISGGHAVFSLYFSGRNDIKRLRWFSSAYFLHDFFKHFFSKKLDLMKLAYMYHHLSGMYLLSCDSREVPVKDILFWGELSNLPSYLLYYHMHKNIKEPTKIRFYQMLQKILYCGIRIPVLTQKMVLYIMNDRPKKHMFAIFPVYLMGIIWSIKILSQKLIKFPRLPRLQPPDPLYLDIRDNSLV